jgi:ATP-dependent DNA helicase DinG
MTNALQQAVAHAFAAGGSLSEVDPRYVERDVQVRMALAVAQAIDERRVLVAEAGTGVGKTFAYLVPTLLSGARALVSTATKSLQDQLFLRDLPRLREALRVPVSLALLKGRASYLCLHRLNQARHGAQLPDRWAVRTLAKVEQWAQSTASGDLAEMEGLDERSSVIPLVTSSRENCLGSECPEYRQCHVMKARRDAMAADIVVVNHHLFFADMALRDSGVRRTASERRGGGVRRGAPAGRGGRAVPRYHARQRAGHRLRARHGGRGSAVRARARAVAGPRRCVRSRCARSCASHALERCVTCAAPLKLRWDERAGRADFAASLEAMATACTAAHEALDTVSELAPDFVKLDERALQLAKLARRFGDVAAPAHVRWIDVTPHQCRLVESPMDIRDALREQIGRAPKAWIFTSATLGDDERLRWFTESAGLDDAATLRVGSPFDYAAHARLYIPRAFPKPNEPGHPAAVARLASSCARALGGRTFVLTTTLRVLQSIGEQLREAFDAQDDDIQVLLQGQAPKRQLMQQFLARPRSVLVGSQSFWEGIDVPGEALQCVLIDKLPFPPPNDPLVEARVKRLEAEGRNAFADYFVAEAAVSLKQGAGRLIRSETDRGLLVVCDPRMAGMNYGRRLREALPPMTPLASEADALAWLRELAAADVPF